MGYALEWFIQLSHVSHAVHHRFKKILTPKFHLLAISFVLLGHMAEHTHQEEENEHQEARIAVLEASLLQIQKKLN